MMTHKAVALFSGGLDSTLAILAILKQGIEVKAVMFLTHFGCGTSIKTSCSHNPLSTAEKYGFEIKLLDVADRFMEIVKNPKFGYGRNLNPCIDCRILMLKEANGVMDSIGADFIVTGEVLGQRPMSQRKDILNVIDREAGTIGYVLRPLSAKLLKITIPEAKGIVNRDMLYDFSGRSRKPQIALAKEFGLIDYPEPAGGCLLTEPNYAHRLRELLVHNPDSQFKEIEMLKIGRHFRFSSSCKIIVGRDKAENETIQSLSESNDYLLKVEGYGSPITLVTGEITEETLRVAASLCVRYSDAKHLSEVEVIVVNGSDTFRLRVSPADDEIIIRYRIEKKNKSLAPKTTPCSLHIS
ncbi:MAG: hypothetical protein OEZ31_00905 [Nitrospirota bacterium]|nr:hypothetical protein [Nitrospirota bacterium]MDH5767504.1 hypothetical protein [Nitrospirota bacterium]